VRLAVLIGAAFLAVAAPAAAQSVATVPAVVAGERVIGRADAPVTVIEYASFTCPHCAQWAADVLPEFKAAYVDTGKVRLVYRDLPTAPAEPSINAALLSRCAAPEAAFAVIELLFSRQATAQSLGWPPAWLADAAQFAGRPADELIGCFENPATEAALNADVAAASAAGVRSTPSIFVDGVLVADPTLEELSRAVDARLAGG
jgi:protein-disulfide isomerase